MLHTMICDVKFHYFNSYILKTRKARSIKNTFSLITNPNLDYLFFSFSSVFKTLYGSNK